MEILNNESSHGALALRKKLSKIPAKLSELFRSMLARDQRRTESLQLCILWILFAKRPLSPAEFRHALWAGLLEQGLVDPELPDDTHMDAVKLATSSSKGLAGNGCGGTTTAAGTTPSKRRRRRGPTARAVPADSHVRLVHDAGDASAVWSFGDAFLKVKLAQDRMAATRECVPLRWLAERKISFTIPTVLYQTEEGLYTHLRPLLVFIYSNDISRNNYTVYA